MSARVYRPYSTLPNEITRWCPSVEVQDSFSAVVEYPTARCAKFAVGVLRERVQANRYRYLFENSLENFLENSPDWKLSGHAIQWLKITLNENSQWKLPRLKLTQTKLPTPNPLCRKLPRLKTPRTSRPFRPVFVLTFNLGLFYWNQAHMKNCKDKKFQFWILNKNSNQPITNRLRTVRANQILAMNRLKSILEFHPFLTLHPINNRK